jgi:hypothetical protein
VRRVTNPNNERRTIKVTCFSPEFGSPVGSGESGKSDSYVSVSSFVAKRHPAIAGKNRANSNTMRTIGKAQTLPKDMYGRQKVITKASEDKISVKI